MKHKIRLPQDLINLIFEYSPEHRENFKKSLKRIPFYHNFEQIHQTGVKKRIKKVLNLCDTAALQFDNWDFESMFRNTCNDLDYFVDVLSNCKCCERHMKRRPPHFNKRKKYVNTRTQTTHNHDCKCFCRFFCRFFHKSVTKTFTPNDPYSTIWHDNLLRDDDDDDNDDFDIESLFT